MDNKRLQYYWKLLKEQLESLLTEAGKTVNHVTGQQGAFADPVDLATAESDRNFLLRLRDRERNQVI